MAVADEQQFCLRWNNFQANITSQFETLRDDEDFIDVTIACEGQRLQAHKVVLSACSPFFKELFKTNPCTHPIIFMRDVEARHIVSLLEFMYAGEVNVAQAQLSAFLKTAESLKIRGLTDTSSKMDLQKEDDTLFFDTQATKLPLGNKHKLDKSQISSSSTVTSSQDVTDLPKVSSPSSKRQCKSESELPRLKRSDDVGSFAKNKTKNQLDLSKTTLQPKVELPDYLSDVDIDEDPRDDNDNDNLDGLTSFYQSGDVTELPGGMEIIPQTTAYTFKDAKQDSPSQGSDSRKLHSLDPRPCGECGKVYSNLSNLRQHMKLIHYPTYVQCPFCGKSFKTDLYLRRHVISAHDGLNSGYLKSGPTNDIKTSSFGRFKYLNINALHKNGVDIKCERALWDTVDTRTDYYNLRFRRRRSSDHWLPFSMHHANGLADDLTDLSPILRDRRDGEMRNRLIKLGEGIEIYEDQLRSVNPAELATCSVTGQRWSRAGSGERPVKPALDRAKVQAIISYVATRFPMVEISRIKQVLAYKCKENSTAFKMKAVRYYG
ncbi:hypothetical protein NQ317_016894 [Molorchus minor]|uniref:Uncharacterized protein n=1 Tax=Molorchus minor TaxID=1323400 RepID=A0ABQ9K5V1_9CUCU|nr:hypothetical protein NQ317_016894 [Molorchus minor]